MIYPVPPADVTDLLKRFTYHKVVEGQQHRYEQIRSDARNLGVYILEHTPKGREQSLALTKLEEAVMWANAAIARSGE